MQPYISFFKFEIPSYGLMIALGIIVANIIGGIVIKKEKLDINDFIIIEAYLFFKRNHRRKAVISFNGQRFN